MQVVHPIVLFTLTDLREATTLMCFDFTIKDKVSSCYLFNHFPECAHELSHHEIKAFPSQGEST